MTEIHNIFQYQTMKTNKKSVGKIKHSNPNTLGKRFQSQTTSLESSLFRTNSSLNTKLSSDVIRCNSQKRVHSVGKIYTTKYSKCRQQTNNQIVLRRYGPSFINYDEIQNKLSNYLQCTINTNCRLKYNYLSPYEPPLAQQINYRAQRLNKPIFFDRNMRTNQTEKDYNYKCQKRVKPLKREILLQENLLYTEKNKQNINIMATIPKKQSICRKNSIDHEQNKAKLQKKLKKMIQEYQNKQKQLTTQLKKIQQTNKNHLKQKQNLNSIGKQITQQSVVETKELIKQIFEKLLEFNLQGICLSSQTDSKLQQIWKSIHKQIILNQHLRISKSFINTENIEAVLKNINQNRIKKIDLAVLKTNTDEYDPFLIQKINQQFKNSNIKLTDNLIIKSIAGIFLKSYEESQRHWIKYFSHQQMQRIFRTITLERQIKGQHKKYSENKEPNLRDLARYLSALFKANLRNRNIYEINRKLKQMSFAGRFIQILQQKLQYKTEKAIQSKKASSIHK